MGLAQRTKLRTSCGRVARHTLPKGTPDDPSNRWLNKCATTVEKVAPKSAKLDRFGPILSRVGPNLAKAWPISTKHGRCLPTVGQFWPMLARMYQMLPSSARSWPSFGQIRHKSAQVWPKSTKFGRPKAESQLPGQLVDHNCAPFPQLLGNCGGRWDRLR